jgi:hypothetical protein
MKTPTLKLTHRNIRARYEMEREHDPKFSYATMAKKFMVDRQTCYKWCRIIPDEKGKEVKDSARCPLPSGVRATAMLEWLNDGVLLAAMGRK